MPTSTTNYNWQKPDVGASIDAWGGLLNTDLDGIDSTVKTVSNVANAALPSATASTTYVAKAGDTMTGPLKVASASGFALDLSPTAGWAAMKLNFPASGQGAGFQGQMNGVVRWSLNLGDATAEGAGDAGSNFSLQAFSNAGVALSNALTIVRATGAATFSGVLNVATPTGVDANFILNKAASGRANQIVGETAGSVRWSLIPGNGAAEGAGNAGSDLELRAYDNTGVSLGSPLYIERKTGFASFNGNGATQYLTAPVYSAGNAVTILNKNGSTNASNIQGRNNSLARWLINLGDATAEGGANAGSDFGVVNFNDAGGQIGTPLTIKRSNSCVQIAGNGATPYASPAAAGAALLTLSKSGSALGCNILGATNGVVRWNMALGDSAAESGANAGSNFAIGSFNDAGVTLGTPMSIARATGIATFPAKIDANSGVVTRPGVGGVGQANAFNISWTTGAQLWIDSTNTGTITVSSDYRIKKDIQLLGSMWERVKALNPISYTHQDYTPPVELGRDDEAKPLIVADDVERWGFVAHELQETLIMDAATGEKDSPTHIQSPNPWTVIATLTKALQEAMTRIEALEAKLVT